MIDKRIIQVLTCVLVFFCAFIVVAVFFLGEPHAKYFIRTPHPYASDSIDDAKRKGTFINEMHADKPQFEVAGSIITIKEVWLEKRAMLNGTAPFKTVQIRSGYFLCLLLEDKNRALLKSDRLYIYTPGERYFGLGFNGTVLTQCYLEEADSTLPPRSFIVLDGKTKKTLVEIKLTSG